MANYFHELFQKLTATGPEQRIPGAVVMAADSSGKIVHRQSGGRAPSSAKPIGLDSTLWVASCTKLFTSVAALQCVERGQLHLDDDVSPVLPEWNSPSILSGFDDVTGEPMLKKATKKITLRHLLTHTSGIGYDNLHPYLKRWREWRGDAVPAGHGDIEKQYLMPLLFEPGCGWEYGGSLDWAGQMVERVNGNISLHQYMKTHIWEPLNMRSTGFRLSENEDLYSRLYPLTLRDPSGKLVSIEHVMSLKPKNDLGGGGLFSSPNDLIKILASILKNDGVLLRKDLVDLMFEPQLPDPADLLEHFASPLGPMYRGGVESDSWNFGLGSTLNMKDVQGVCRKGTMTWAGRPNIYWWIDRLAGTCGFYASQLAPSADPDSLRLSVEFRRYIYQEYGRDNRTKQDMGSTAT